VIYISLFNISIEKLDTVGKKYSELFKKNGAFNIGALLINYPIYYDDWSEETPLGKAEGKAVVRAMVKSEPAISDSGSGKKIYKIECSSSGNKLIVTFFNNKGTANLMKRGEEFLIMGDFKRTAFGLEVVCPKIKNLKFAYDKLEPVYSQINGLPYWKTARAVKEALKLLPDKIPETIPESIISRYRLASLDFAMKSIHFPENKKELAQARRRLIFEELLIWCLALGKIKKRADCGIIINNFYEEFLKLIPFKLTSAQDKAIRQCVEDMKSGYAMRRLLQGDVGSGKTAVAMALCYNAVKSGFRAAVMAPTEILALQHYKSFKEIFDNSINIEIITGTSTKKERDLINLKFSENNSGILIGTHALISNDVDFADPALVITDEQHRFGVEQRLKLTRKGKNVHTLVMSATPIPRSLGMVFYGDMDFCILNELPPGRRIIKTLVVGSEKRKNAFEFIKLELLAGRQCYIICAQAEDSEKDNEKECEEITVESYKNKFLDDFFQNFHIAAIHGKMKPGEKEKIMKEFAAKNIDLLVATTVVEVGIDIPNASVILIENAERFGLASLHQLRGRVGRGNHPGCCILISDKRFGPAWERLKIMKNSSDGFFLAKKDLELRGPGEFFGIKQHGKLSKMLISALSDNEITAQCRAAADEILESDFELKSYSLRFLKSKIEKFFNTA
jgi:ATP-dependent DNA helicase RecG